MKISESPLISVLSIKGYTPEKNIIMWRNKAAVETFSLALASLNVQNEMSATQHHSFPFLPRIPQSLTFKSIKGLAS